MEFTTEFLLNTCLGVSIYRLQKPKSCLMQFSSAASGRCCPSVWTVALQLYAIFILRFECLDHRVYRPGGWTSSAWLALSRIASGRNGHVVQTVAVVFPYLCFGKKSIYLSNTKGHPTVLLRRPNGCNLDQFEASGHRGRSRQKVLVV
jgi:hypothetical protein